MRIEESESIKPNKQLNILWLEDQLIFESLFYVIDKDGNNVDRARDTVQARDYLRARAKNYDVMVIDLMLPSKGPEKEYKGPYVGVEFLRTMINDFKIEPNRIAVLTIISSEEIFGELERMNIENILVKPTTAARVAEMVYSTAKHA